MSFVIIYITNPDLKTAKKIANYLLKKQLVACANFFPIESAYWWQGRIENDKEVVAIVKTAKKNWARVKAEIEKIHPYETPCVMKIEVEANQDYADWIKSEVN